MTKQQQQKINKVNNALDLFKQGKSLKEASIIVGYSRPDKLKRALIELGYKEQDGEWINDDLTSNTVCNTTCITNVENIGLASIKELEFVTMLEQEQDTIRNMIEWYKRYSNTDNTSNTIIKIELPQSDNTMISTRSNKVVWEQFKIFAKNNSANFKMGDLVAQALLDYMNKYK